MLSMQPKSPQGTTGSSPAVSTVGKGNERPSFLRRNLDARLVRIVKHYERGRYRKSLHKTGSYQGTRFSHTVESLNPKKENAATHVRPARRRERA